MSAHKILVALICIFASAPAMAANPKFTAEVGVNSVAIYSTANKPATCSLSVPFTFFYQGKRTPTKQYCNEAKIVAGKHMLVCEASDPQIGDPKIEGPVEVHCTK